MSESHVKTTLAMIQERRKIKDTVILNGRQLSIPEVLGLSADSGVKVVLAEDALKEIVSNQKYLKEKLDEGLIVYGINTGFGGSAEVRSCKLDDVQTALIRHVNAGMGRVFPVHLTRAAMVTRANCLAKGYSGVRPDVPQVLVELINHDITPRVPLRGSVSASGDLMPLGYIAAAMIGRADLQVVHAGVQTTCPKALEAVRITPITLGPKEGLAIINADSFAAGVSAPTLYDANLMLLLTQVCTGMSVEALHGRTESFHPLIHECLPHVGQKEIARNMLRVLDDSQLAITTLDMHLPDKYGVLKQDRYSLRSSPQWLGSVAETLVDACRRITIELNSANDNPIIDHRTNTIAHGANFQGETMSIAMDQTRQVMGVCGKLLLAQFQEVVNGKLNFGLPPNLSGCDINLDFGFKGCDTAMASYMSELDHFVNPMSNHVISAETHNQSVNSMALVSARLTAEAVEIVQMMVTNLLCLTAQAVDLRLLRNLAMEESDKLREQYPEATNLLEKTEWYDLMFMCDERIEALKEASGMQGTKAAAEIVVYVRMRNLYKRACNGEMDASKYMGKGTSRMYNFIRKELDIPFYCGQPAIDTWLGRILQAIQSRSVENVLLDIFTSVSPPSRQNSQTA
ncbi:uncharacterized protein LOC128239212 isoform X2 [Mya arenaria]|nr:uncharacterized protein LOC128239212 isoform X2 [Mya arenaria]